MARCAKGTERTITIGIGPRVVVHGEEQVACAVVSEAIVKRDGGPCVGREGHRAAEDEVAFRDVHPVVSVIKARFVRVEHVDV